MNSNSGKYEYKKLTKKDSFRVCKRNYDWEFLMNLKFIRKNNYILTSVSCNQYIQ